jgi:hypothetical protein
VNTVLDERELAMEASCRPCDGVLLAKMVSVSIMRRIRAGR